MALLTSLHYVTIISLLSPILICHLFHTSFDFPLHQQNRHSTFISKSTSSFSGCLDIPLPSSSSTSAPVTPALAGSRTEHRSSSSSHKISASHSAPSSSTRPVYTYGTHEYDINTSPNSALGNQRPRSASLPFAPPTQSQPVLGHAPTRSKDAPINLSCSMGSWCVCTHSYMLFLSSILMYLADMCLFLFEYCDVNRAACKRLYKCGVLCCGITGKCITISVPTVL